MKHLLSIMFFSLSVAVTAAENESEVPEEALLEAAEFETLDVGEDPLELERLEVSGIQFSLEQETALRMVRQALKRSKSGKREDKDVWVCWYRRPAGTHFRYLECARNGDLWALRPDRNFGNVLSGGAVGADYGTIMRSQRPVNRKKFEAMLNLLPGSNDLDKEFVALTLAGQEPPQDIPSDSELDSFAEAYRVVTELEQNGSDEFSMIQAIEANGLSVSRYNRIVDLVETFQSIENEVAFRLGTLERPSD